MHAKFQHAHSPKAIQQRLEQGPPQSYLRDWVYGGVDGVVTTFAIVSGVAGADLGILVVLILGAANLLADGFSMAAGNFLATQAEFDLKDQLREVEKQHIKQEPAGEKEEVRQILKSKGLSGWALKRATNTIIKNQEHWIELMLKEEYGLPGEIRSPLKAATSTFLSFVLCGLIPLLPYLFGGSSPFLWSSITTALVFFAIGSLKSRWTLTPWWRSGLYTLGIGASAAFLAYFISSFLKGFLGDSFSP